MYEVAKLASGKHFGELALTTNKPRAATIKAVTTKTHYIFIISISLLYSLASADKVGLRKGPTKV